MQARILFVNPRYGVIEARLARRDAKSKAAARTAAPAAAPASLRSEAQP
jgi:hypothetical protein